jgi:hypothetical protein
MLPARRLRSVFALCLPLSLIMLVEFPARGANRAASHAANPGRAAAAPLSEPDSITTGPDGQPELIHFAKRGESAHMLARLYLAKTVYMTVPELESAIERANGGLKGGAVRTGERIIIPGLLVEPIAETPRLVGRNFEARAIYLTGYTAGSEKGIELIRRWHEAGGNSVVFDLKDFDGWINVPFDNALKPDRGFVLIHNLPKFVHFLHSLNLHAIGRIACFRDAALATSHPELAPRSRRTGGPWHEGRAPDWVDPSIPKVQQYILALAHEGMNAGLDEIQFDYVRFPAEGDQEDVKFAFQQEHPDWPRSRVITDFVTRAYNEIHPTGVLVSLDVFGVMAWQRRIDLDHTGQDIAALARHTDVLSPMIYPSHFFHFDGYTDPGDAPEHFINEAMKRFNSVTAGTNVVIRPWLQAFGWRTKTYSTTYILTQVSVARANGGIGFLFWNAHNDYSKPFVAMAVMQRKPELYFGISQSRLSTASHASPAVQPTAAGPAPVASPFRGARP